MFAIVFILVAALVTVIAFNHGLRSDLAYYKEQCNENWKNYQSQRASHVELLDEHIRIKRDFAEARMAQADRLVKLRKHCEAISQKVKPQIELMRVMLDSLEAIVPERYVCPKCVCSWRDNGDGTMSLFDETFKSCEFCESAPLNQLDLVRSDGVVIADAIPRQDA